MSDEIAPEVQEELQGMRERLSQLRTQSKAHLIGVGRTEADEATEAEESARRQLEKLGVANQLGQQPGFLHAVWQSRSRDADLQREGKAKLAELGSRWSDVPTYSKATLGDTAAAGGNLVPNNLVASFIEQAAVRNPFRRVCNVITGVVGAGVDLPFESAAPTRATIIAAGGTKTNLNFSTPNYSATLYTLAQIYDVSNQLLRHSAGAAEQLVRSRLGRALADGEAYYIISGSGSGEPLGIDTALTGAGYTTAHSASDSTVAGSVKAALVTAVEELAGRNHTPNAAILNPGDAAHARLQGSNEAGFWNDLTDITDGLKIYTTTNVTSGEAFVGDFSQATLYIGQGYRVDVSGEAGDRWDVNLTGFRAELEIAFSAGPLVNTGAVQKITGLVP